MSLEETYLDGYRLIQIVLHSAVSIKTYREIFSWLCMGMLVTILCLVIQIHVVYSILNTVDCSSEHAPIYKRRPITYYKVHCVVNRVFWP